MFHWLHVGLAATVNISLTASNHLQRVTCQTEGGWDYESVFTTRTSTA